MRAGGQVLIEFRGLGGRVDEVPDFIRRVDVLAWIHG